MRHLLSIVILGFLATSSAHAAPKGIAQVLAEATNAMKQAGYRSTAQLDAVQAQHRLKARRTAVKRDLLHLINDGSFLQAFEKHGGSMVLAESPKGERLYLEVSQGGVPGNRVGLYETRKGKTLLVGHVPEWLTENIHRFPSLTSRALRTTVGEWTQANFTTR